VPPATKRVQIFAYYGENCEDYDATHHLDKLRHFLSVGKLKVKSKEQENENELFIILQCFCGGKQYHF
jgi:hypothetical protein